MQGLQLQACLVFQQCGQCAVGRLLGCGQVIEVGFECVQWVGLSRLHQRLQGLTLLLERGQAGRQRQVGAE